MPLPLSVGLLVVVVVLLVLRFSVSALPPRGLARPLRPVDGVIALVGVLGLVGHCGAMFYPAVIGLIPGARVYMRVVNAMGTTSVVLYVVPAVMIMIGLRRQHPAAVVLLAASVLGVGITMYDGGSLNVHLTAISIAELVLALFAALLIARAGQGYDDERPRLPGRSAQVRGRSG